MIGSNTRDYKRDTRREAVPPQPVHVLEAGRPAGVDGHLQRPEPRGLHRPPRADQHAAAGAGDAQRPAVRRGRPRPGPAGAQGGRRRRRSRASTSWPGGCWPGRSGREELPVVAGVARPSCSRYYKAHPDEAKKLIAVGESKADPALDAADAGRLDHAGERADEPGRSAEQVSRRSRHGRAIVRRLRDTRSHSTARTAMNPFNEYVRHDDPPPVLRRGANAVGWAALASLLGGERPGAGRGEPAGARPPLPARRTSPPKAKHVIYLHMVGGPPQMDLYDYKPKMDEWYDKDLPDSVRMGQRLTTMTSRPDAVPDRPVEVQVRPARQVRHVGQRAAAVHGARWSTTCASSAACTPRRSTTSRPSRYMQTGNQVTGRPCLGAWASLRPGLAQREPADVRRPGRQADATPSRCRRSRPGCGRRATCPASTPASRSAPAATRSCTSTTRRACPPTSAAARSTGSRRSTR